MKSTRISRRRLIQGGMTAGAGMAMLALVGCGDDDEAATGAAGTGGATATAGTGTTTAKVKRGGKLTHSLPPGSIPHLDLHQASFWQDSNFSQYIYSGLLRLRVEDQRPMPLVAKDMPEQPDNVTYVFRLQPGIKFHNKPPVNGRELVAEDVIYSLERARKKDPLFVNGSYLSSISKMEAVDAHTVRMTTSSPDAVLLTTLALHSMGMVAKESVEKYGDLKSAESAIGTGPFIVDRYDRDTSVRYKAHPEYFRKGYPVVDELESLFLADPWPRFQSGALSYATVPGPEIDGFATRNPNIPTHEGVGYGTANGWILNTKVAPFDDVRVRRALALLTDQKKRIAWMNYNNPTGRVSICLGSAHEVWNLTPKETEQLEYFSTANFEANVKKALQLLDAAGFNASKPLQFKNLIWNTPGRGVGVELADYVKTEYERVSQGVLKMTLTLPDYGTMVNQWARGQIDTTTSTWVNGPEPDHALFTMLHSTGGRNYGKYSNPKMDQLLEKQRTLFKFEERKAVIHEVLRLAADEVPTVWTGNVRSIIARQKNLNDFSGGDQDRWKLEETWLS